MAKTKLKPPSEEETTRPRIKERNYPVYKYRSLIAAIGTDKEVAGLIKDCGFDPPPPATIRGWRTRDSVPARWAPLLITQAMTTGRLKDTAALLAGSQIKP